MQVTSEEAKIVEENEIKLPQEETLDPKKNLLFITNQKYSLHNIETYFQKEKGTGLILLNEQLLFKERDELKDLDEKLEKMVQELNQPSTLENLEKKKEKKKETTGPQWFNMEKQEITPEIEKDLQILKLRHVLNPKHHYKKDKSLLANPKFFQIGTILDAPNDPYQRLTKKQRKETIVDEILAEAESGSSWFQKKFKEGQDKKKKFGEKGYKAIRQHRKNTWQQTQKQKKK